MTRRGRVVVLAAACLVSATIAFMRFQPSPRQESPSIGAQPQLAAVEQSASKAPAPRPAVRKTAAKARPAASATPLPVPKSDVTTVVTAPAPRDEASAPLQIVTISGCLEQDDARFRLKDTTGDGAPKGRSWRSGFLRKNAATIDVVDQADRLHLPTYVGQRVSVTGTLNDREIQVRSVSIVAESCQEKSA